MLLLAASFGTALSQIELECNFQAFFTQYICYLDRIEVLNPAESVTITGQHLGDRTNADVNTVLIDNSNTPFMIQELFEAFPNLYELAVFNSNLQSINVSSSVQLIWLDLYRNNISRIEPSSVTGLASQRRLNYLDWTSNQIREIDEDAFVGLDSVLSLFLMDNLIEEIRNQTFHPLTNITRIELERNRLTRIEETTFAMNRNLQALYLESNEINAISPLFLASQRESLEYVNLSDNRCVSQFFNLNNIQENWDLMNNELLPCFDNFNGTVPELRRVIMEFTGSIAIYDEFGNILARF